MTCLSKNNGQGSSNALFPDQHFVQIGLAGILPYPRMIKHGVERYIGPAVRRPLKLLLIEKLISHDLEGQITLFDISGIRTHSSSNFTITCMAI